MQTVLKVGLSALTLFAIIILSKLYEVSLFEKSLTLIPELQAGASDFTKSFWSIYSDDMLYALMHVPVLLTYLLIE